MSISNSQAASLEELRQIALDHFWPHEQQVADFAKPDGFRVAVKGEGCWVTDSTGRKFFDANAGMWFQNVGYGRKEIADAVYEQLQRINYAPPPTASEPALRLAAKVASLSPDKNSRAFFVSGGSEAVESALKMAKAYHRLKGNPGRYKIISRRGSYHGATLATLSLGGRPDAGPQHYGPLMPGNVHVTQPYSYRCLYCSKFSECSLAVAFENPDVDPMQVTISGSPERCAERIKALSDAGVWHFVLEFQFHGQESPAFGMKQMEKFVTEVGPLL